MDLDSFSPFKNDSRILQFEGQTVCYSLGFFYVVLDIISISSIALNKLTAEI